MTELSSVERHTQNPFDLGNINPNLSKNFRTLLGFLVFDHCRTNLKLKLKKYLCQAEIDIRVNKERANNRTKMKD